MPACHSARRAPKTVHSSVRKSISLLLLYCSANSSLNKSCAWSLHSTRSSTGIPNQVRQAIWTGRNQCFPSLSSFMSHSYSENSTRRGHRLALHSSLFSQPSKLRRSTVNVPAGHVVLVHNLIVKDFRHTTEYCHLRHLFCLVERCIAPIYECHPFVLDPWSSHSALLVWLFYFSLTSPLSPVLGY